MPSFHQTMRFSEVIWRVWYRIRGRRKPSVGIDVFGPLMTGLLATMLPSHRIVSDSIGLGGEWTESLEQQMIDAHVEHVVNSHQPAFNALMDMKPTRSYQRLHRLAMTVSRAYGETIAAYAEYRRMFLSSEYLSDAYTRKQADGQQWDSLTREHTRALLNELQEINAQDSEAYRYLEPSKVTLDMLECIASAPSGTAVSRFG